MTACLTCRAKTIEMHSTLMQSKRATFMVIFTEKRYSATTDTSFILSNDDVLACYSQFPLSNHKQADRPKMNNVRFLTHTRVS